MFILRSLEDDGPNRLTKNQLYFASSREKDDDHEYYVVYNPKVRYRNHYYSFRFEVVDDLKNNKLFELIFDQTELDRYD